MRAIKFRAWDNKHKHMWPINERLRLQLQGDSWKIDSLDYGFSSQMFSSWNDKEVILMQYTGLKDKNGKEIYEGDIILFTDNLPHVVIFGEYQHATSGASHDLFYGWWLRKFRGSKDKCYEEGYPLQEMFSQDIEVVGNIYETPIDK